MNKVLLVTGGSRGIGAATARSVAMIRRAESSPPTGKYLGLRFRGTFRCWLKRCNSSSRYAWR